MNVILRPSFKSTQEYPIIKAPSSKSITHRAIICAAFSKSETEIVDPLWCNDTVATKEILARLGASFEVQTDKVIVKPIRAIHNIQKDLFTKPFECHDSATTFRFFVPLLILLAQYNGVEKIHIKASPQLTERITSTPLEFSYTLSDYTFTFNVIQLPNTLKCEETTQSASGLLLANSLLTDEPMNLVLVDSVIDPYILLTIDCIRKFGYNLSISYSSNGISLKLNQKPAKPIDSYTVEGDYSAISNFIVLGTKFPLKISGLNPQSLQADAIILTILKQMGAKISWEEGLLKITPSELSAISLDLSRCPDIGPLLIGLASVTKGVTKITGLKRLIHKESNRLMSTIEILKRARASITIKDNSLIIEGRATLSDSQSSPISCYQDHRLLMMLAALIPFFTSEIVVTDANSIDKSFPNFFQEYAKLGANYTIFQSDAKIKHNSNNLKWADTLTELALTIKSIPGQKVILTDDTLKAHHSYRGFWSEFDFPIIVVPTGESAKSLETYASVTKALLDNQVERKSTLILIGGGVVTDLGNFVASTYKRGVSQVINVPTTLIGMIDAAIGGKCGLNFDNLKNIIGLTHQPDQIIIYRDFLKTLPVVEIRSGICEIIKYYFLKRHQITNYPNLSRIKALRYEENITRDLIIECISIKMEIVRSDPNGNSIRNLLNYGHTIGHALESSVGFKYPHGLAVIYGMYFETNNKLIRHELLDIIQSLKLARAQQIISRPVPWKSLVIHLLHDKKLSYVNSPSNPKDISFSVVVFTAKGVAKLSNLTLDELERNYHE